MHYLLIIKFNLFDCETNSFSITAMSYFHG